MFALTKFTNRACVESVKRSKTVICTSKYYGEFRPNLTLARIRDKTLGLARPKFISILILCYILVIQFRFINIADIVYWSR